MEKKTFKTFLKKYWVAILIATLAVIGIVAQAYYNEKEENENQNIIGLNF